MRAKRTRLLVRDRSIGGVRMGVWLMTVGVGGGGEGGMSSKTEDMIKITRNGEGVMGQEEAEDEGIEGIEGIEDVVGEGEDGMVQVILLLKQSQIQKQISQHSLRLQRRSSLAKRSPRVQRTSLFHRRQEGEVGQTRSRRQKHRKKQYSS